MKRPLLRSIAFVFAAALVLGACSLGPREQWADSIRGGFEKARRAGQITVVQTVSVKAIETTVSEQPTLLLERAEGVVDAKTRRARLKSLTGRKTDTIYDDLVVYASRSPSSLQVSKQKWARFDYEREPSDDINVNDRRLAIGTALISPAIAMEVLDGILTGSVEELGREPKGGDTNATKYRARLAPDAAVTEIRGEDRKDGVTRMFDNLGIQQDDFPVAVWIDGDDAIRGIRFSMRQQKDRVNAFALTSTWEFFGPAKDTIALPERGETLRSRRFRDFVTEATRQF